MNNLRLHFFSFLPQLSKEANSLSEAIDLIKKEFLKKIPNIKADELKLLDLDRTELTDSIEEFCKNLKENVINNYYTGSPQKAAIELEKLLDLKDKDNNILDSYKLIKNGANKFRMRASKDYHLYKQEEMFHISYKNRNIVSNQRYSIPGFPCLYLGSSLYDCWEEMRRPNLEKINYVAINNTEDLVLLDISFPEKITSIKDLKQLIIFLLCTLIVKDDENTFKYEYVLPQLILQIVITMKDAIYYDGIRYLSSRYFKDDYLLYSNKKIKPENSFNIMYNYVIPVKNANSKNGYCPTLLRQFVMSNTFSPFLYRFRMVSFYNCINRINDYRKSIFYYYETAPEIKDLRLIKIKDKET